MAAVVNEALTVTGAEVDLDKVRADFERDGCAVVKGFTGPESTAALRNQIVELVRKWEDPPPGEGGVFRTDEDQTNAQGAEDYFMSSARKVRFFWEPSAEKVHYPDDPEKTLLQLNKIGHGLHESDPVFRAYSHSERVRSLVHGLGWKAPVLPQSMYIVKNPKIGGEVTAHQDSTFLFTDPRPSCLGLWLALDTCDLANGCLWFRPGSHAEPVRRHFSRRGDPEVMGFDQLVTDDQMSPLEGKSIVAEGCEESLRAQGFVPVECGPGDLVLIHGQVEHLSLPNFSERPRHSFQLHLVEGPSEGVHWSKRNWLQYPEGTSPSLL